MTRRQFEEKATRALERELRIPSGWWGTYNDVQGPNGARVRFGTCWVISLRGKRVSGHDSRTFAISKARAL